MGRWLGETNSKLMLRLQDHMPREALLLRYVKAIEGIMSCPIQKEEGYASLVNTILHRMIDGGIRVPEKAGKGYDKVLAEGLYIYMHMEGHAQTLLDSWEDLFFYKHNYNQDLKEDLKLFLQGNPKAEWFSEGFNYELDDTNPS